MPYVPAHAAPVAPLRAPCAALSATGRPALHRAAPARRPSIVAAPGTTGARRASYFYRSGGTVYVAASPRALARLLAARGVA